MLFAFSIEFILIFLDQNKIIILLLHRISLYNHSKDLYFYDTIYKTLITCIIGQKTGLIWRPKFKSSLLKKGTTDFSWTV